MFASFITSYTFFLLTNLRYWCNDKTFSFSTFAFPIRPSITFEIRHSLSSYMCIKVLIPYLKNDMFQLLVISFYIFHWESFVTWFSTSFAYILPFLSEGFILYSNAYFNVQVWDNNLPVQGLVVWARWQRANSECIHQYIVNYTSSQSWETCQCICHRDNILYHS